MERAFEAPGLTHPLMVMRNGQEAFRWLNGQGWLVPNPSRSPGNENGAEMVQ